MDLMAYPDHMLKVGFAFARWPSSLEGVQRLWGSAHLGLHNRPVKMTVVVVSFRNAFESLSSSRCRRS